MNARELFGLIVRVVGLLVLVAVPLPLAVLLLFFPLAFIVIVPSMAIATAVGLYLLQGAPFVVELAYRTAERRPRVRRYRRRGAWMRRLRRRRASRAGESTSPA